MIENVYTIGVTGHRPARLGGRADIIAHEDVLQRIARFLLMVARQHDNQLVVLTGMAQGWDLTVANATKLGMFLGAREGIGLTHIGVIPCADQTRFWTDARAKYWYEKHLIHSHTVQLSPQPYSPRLMHERNAWIIERAELMLACWNGRPGSGTAACVRCAQERGVRVRNVYTEVMAMLG